MSAMGGSRTIAASISAFASAFMFPEAVFATAGDSNSVEQTFCNIAILMTGTTGVAVSTVAVIGIGIRFLMGKISTKKALVITLGIGTMFGASSIVLALGGNDNSCAANSVAVWDTATNDIGLSPTLCVVDPSACSYGGPTPAACAGMSPGTALYTCKNDPSFYSIAQSGGPCGGQTGDALGSCVMTNLPMCYGMVQGEGVYDCVDYPSFFSSAQASGPCAGLSGDALGRCVFDKYANQTIPNTTTIIP